MKTTANSKESGTKRFSVRDTNNLPDLNSPPFGGETFQTNLIMPEPTIFLDRKFPICSIVRPTETEGAAMGAVKFLTDTGLFRDQSAEFFDTLKELAEAADAAHGRGRGQNGDSQG